MNRKTTAWFCLTYVVFIGPAIAGEISTVYSGDTNGGITLDSAGDIYAANYGDISAITGSEFVWKISPTGAFAPVVFVSDINIASGNDFDSQDNLFQSNFGGDSISKIDPSGVATTFSNLVNNPVGIAIDDLDNLFVNSCLDNSIIKIAPDGTTTTFVSSPQFNCPNGITRAPNGDFYVINWHDGRIFHITAAGAISNFTTIVAQGGHVTVAGDRLYATSFGANQIFGFDLSGTNAGNLVVTIGSGVAGSTDGSYSVASFDRPNGITTDATGEVLYVTDQNGVRKVVLEDEVAPPPPPPPPPPPSGGGGGGGSVGWGLIAILGGVLFIGRLRRPRLEPVTPAFGARYFIHKQLKI